MRGEVVSSTFDEPASRHVQVAEMVIEKPSAGRTQTRRGYLARFHHSLSSRLQHRSPSSVKCSQAGGCEALQRAKRFFGAARNIEEGGSLTILATALIDTVRAWMT